MRACSSCTGAERGHAVVRARLERLGDRVVAVGSSRMMYGGPGPAPRAHLAAELRPAAAGQVPVDDGDVGRVGREEHRHRLGALARLDGIEACDGEAGGDLAERGA